MTLIFSRTQLTLIRRFRSACAACVFAARIAVITAATTFLPNAVAGPGAHGPNGEHLDGPPTTATASAAPSVEAKSDLFELVGRVSGGGLALLIDRFATNAPVMRAAVTVELGALKSVAKFHDEIGDYSIDDPAFVAALLAPGTHALVFTIIDGNDSDLLEGSLVVPTSSTDNGTQSHAYFGFGWRYWLAGAVVIVAVLLALWLRARKVRISGTPNNWRNA